MKVKIISLSISAVAMIVMSCKNNISHDPCISEVDCGKPELVSQMKTTPLRSSYSMVVADPQAALSTVPTDTPVTNFLDVMGDLAKILTQDPNATKELLQQTGDTLTKVFVDGASKVLKSPDIAALIDGGQKVVSSVTQIVQTVEKVLSSKNPLGDILATFAGGGISAMNPLTFGAMFFANLGGNDAMTAISDDIKVVKAKIQEVMAAVQQILGLSSLIYANQYWMQLDSYKQTVVGLAQVVYDAKKAGDREGLISNAKKYITSEDVESSIYATVSLGLRFADENTATVYPADFYDQHISSYTERCNSCLGGLMCGGFCGSHWDPNWSPDFFNFASPVRVSPVPLSDLTSMIEIIREKIKLIQVAFEDDPQRQRLYLSVTAARYHGIISDVDAELERRFKSMVLDKIDYYSGTSWQNLQGVTQATLKAKLEAWAKVKYENVRQVSVQLRAAMVELKAIQMAAAN